MKQLQRYVLFACLLLNFFATIAQAEQQSALYPLRRDPFDFSSIAPPEKIIEQNVHVEEPVVTFELRATLISTGQSLANINGTIVMEGEEIEGFRLLKIVEGEVILEKNGESISVSLKK